MITVVSVSMAVQSVSFFFKAREHWECLSREALEFKVHVGPRGSLGVPCSQGDPGTVVFELAGQHPSV